ncbi:hypothetical protein [Haloarcula salinisoli]|uniref:Uncharacterized protein n=1 Tax=Haloarcula salinisoli TaxID=2487746 RepID=A0A8J8CDQ3_9EURY|nr:hypothetical protein [Halomicroarcula salinisoli]MBX0287562.1 hypothetical protein [Halomicroarcula salinisoli]MBX0304870.1 hypothetical protein [Halomicroarcula salinisoli]
MSPNQSESPTQSETESTVASLRRRLALLKQVVTILLALATLAKMAGWL